MATQHDVNTDIFRRLDDQDAKLDRIAEDVAYMRGVMDGQQGAPIQADGTSAILNKQNAITVALAGLITTIGTILAAVFGGK